MATAITIANPVKALAGGVNAYGGQGQEFTVEIGGQWAIGDMANLILTDAATGIQTLIGNGNVTGIIATFCYTFNQKVYLLAGSTGYFCAIEEPTVWDDPNAAGNSFITFSNYHASSVDNVAVAPYQGGLCFWARRSVQIWNIDADPANNSTRQVLENIGTVAGLSVQAIGDMDVYGLADNGFRSVRVRDASNNAIIADVGTPVDTLVTGVVATLTDAQKAASCGAVEPTTNRYWCFIPDPNDADNGVGKIYVFSYFPSGQIAAWSLYSPTYQVTQVPSATVYPNPASITYAVTVGKRYAWTPGANETKLVCGTTTIQRTTANVNGVGSFVATNATVTITGTAAAASFTGLLTLTTPFTPVKFVTYKGQIWARAADGNLYQYGGANNNTYENCGCYMTTPYSDSQSPQTLKDLESCGASFEGYWIVQGSADFAADKFKTLYQNTQPTFMYQRIGWGVRGSHYAFNMIEDGDGYARFSSVIVDSSGGAEK